MIADGPVSSCEVRSSITASFDVVIGGVRGVLGFLPAGNESSSSLVKSRQTNMAAPEVLKFEKKKKTR